ncbi:MAG: hypothetical protein FRX49_10011 [Trebouxia sp. A1-2]|nr:MAG: hypothetical protein FRX49_10011 [Trebouxia sp. A1-2]
MSTVERAFTAVAIVLSVLLSALTVALQLSISDAGFPHSPSESSEFLCLLLGSLCWASRSPDFYLDFAGTGVVDIVPAGFMGVKPATCTFTTDKRDPGSVGKAFRQLILTLSLFLIAAANHKGSRCVMMGFLPFHDFTSSPSVQDIHSRLLLTVRPFFINWSTKSTKSTKGDQDDDDAEEEEDNAGPVDSLTSLASLINDTKDSSRSLRNPIRDSPSQDDHRSAGFSDSDGEEESLPLGHGFLVGALPNPNHPKPWMEAFDTATYSKEMICRARPSCKIKAGDSGGGGQASGINTGSVTTEIKPYKSFCVPTEKDQESHEQVKPIDVFATALTGADAPKAQVVIPRPPDDERLMSDKHITLKAQNSLKKLKRTALGTKKALFKEKRLVVKQKMRDKLCNLLSWCGSSSEVNVV